MALSGSLTTNKYDTRYYKLTWTATQDIASNSSTLSYTLTAESDSSYSEWYAERTLKVVLAGTTIVDKTDRVERWDGTIKTGTIKVTHSADGTKTISGSIQAAVYGTAVNLTASGNFTLDAIPRKATITNAPNFTDVDNPVITYSNPAGNSVTSLQACISFTGSAANVPYRDIEKTGSEYLFELSPEEKQTLIDGVTSGYSRQVIFYIKTVIGGVTYYHNYPVTFTLTDYAPTVTLSVQEANNSIKALTGGYRYILGYSNLSYTLTASGNKGANISSYEISCGGVKKTTATGTFTNIGSNVISYKVTDSRGNKTENSLTVGTVRYTSPTCSQEIAMEIEGETGAKVTINLKGDYFNNTFGQANNELKLYVKYNGAPTEWVELTDTPTLNGNTYSLTTYIVDGLSYDEAYTFQCKAKDKVTDAVTTEYTIRLKPAFDWGETDFNLNVPLCMNGEQVLRYTDTKRTVLSANGADMYLRPNGTSTDDGQVRIFPDGKVTINNGAVTLNNMMSYNALETYSAPTEQYSYFFVVKQAFACGSVTLPVWTRGIFVNGGSSPNDGVIMAVDTNLNFYICYRNNGSWTGRKL